MTKTVYFFELLLGHLVLIEFRKGKRQNSFWSTKNRVGLRSLSFSKTIAIFSYLKFFVYWYWIFQPMA